MPKVKKKPRKDAPGFVAKGEMPVSPQVKKRRKERMAEAREARRKILARTAAGRAQIDALIAGVDMSDVDHLPVVTYPSGVAPRAGGMRSKLPDDREDADVPEPEPYTRPPIAPPVYPMTTDLEPELAPRVRASRGIRGRGTTCSVCGEVGHRSDNRKFHPRPITSPPAVSEAPGTDQAVSVNDRLTEGQPVPAVDLDQLAQEFGDLPMEPTSQAFARALRKLYQAARTWRTTPPLDAPMSEGGSTVPWVRAHLALERAIDEAMALEAAESPSDVEVTEPVPGMMQVRDLVDQHVRRVLAETRNISEAARRLGIERSTLQRRIRRDGIEIIPSLADDAPLPKPVRVYTCGACGERGHGKGSKNCRLTARAPAAPSGEASAPGP